MPASLTIAIPTYNRAALLRQSREGALARMSVDVQILVSDNGSDDDTLERTVCGVANLGHFTFRSA